jgi:hypothetical protein
LLFHPQSFTAPAIRERIAEVYTSIVFLFHFVEKPNFGWSLNAGAGDRCPHSLIRKIPPGAVETL